MTRVVAPSRLHFGLLHVPVDDRETWPGSRVPVRLFGGAGLMIDRPGAAVRVERAPEWSAAGPSASRALKVARNFEWSLLGRDDEPLRVTVEACPPEHVGLGVGTQLSLSVASAAADVLGHGDLTPADLAREVGRGERSRVGVFGFAGGGMIVEAGKRPRQTPEAAGILQRVHIPDDWRVVLACPRSATRWHGDAEDRAFGRRRSPESAVRSAERLSRLLLLGLWPAAAEADYPAFGEALYEYNREAGAAFAEDQGGVYAAPEVEGLIRTVRDWGVPGVGQSSWGPTVFAVTPDPASADALARRIREAAPDVEFVLVSSANRTGAVVTRPGSFDRPYHPHE